MTPEVKERIEQIRHGIVPEGYKKSKAGVVPEDWTEYAIGDCLERVERPVAVQPDEVYTQIGIRSHGKGLFYKEPVSGESLGNKAVFWIEPDCFVLNIVFAWEQAIGKTTQNEVGMIGSHRFPMYRPVGDKIDIDYLISYLMTKRGKDILEAASPGGAGRNRTLGQERFMRSKLVLPPIAEQRYIADILTAQDKVIELKEKLLAEKQQQKKYLMQQLLMRRKRLAGFGGKWRQTRIADIGEIVSGGTPDTKEPLYWDGTIPWCTPTDISSSGKYIYSTERNITQMGLDNSAASLVPEGSILMCSRASVGPRCINKVPMATNQGFKSIICYEDFADTEFIFYLISVCERDFLRLANGSTFLELSKCDFENYVTLIPGLKEQKAIAKILATADREIDFFKQEIEQEKQKKKALMQLLLTGLVRVNA